MYDVVTGISIHYYIQEQVTVELEIEIDDGTLWKKPGTLGSGWKALIDSIKDVKRAYVHLELVVGRG